MRSHLVQGNGLQILMRFIKDRSAGCFVDAPALHADQSVLNEVQKTDAVSSADLIQFQDDLLCAHLFTVQRTGNALFEVQ